jgi:hypothetical protein
VYWTGLSLALLVALFFAFYFLDGFLPGSGMF